MRVLILNLAEELSALLIPEEDLVNAGLGLLVTLGQRGVLSPAHDDPQDPEQLLLGELEDGVFSQQGWTHWTRDTLLSGGTLPGHAIQITGVLELSELATASTLGGEQSRGSQSPGASQQCRGVIQPPSPSTLPE